MLYKAHINGNKIQSCKQHCINTANYAKENAETLNLANTAYLCGLLHDTGKKYRKADRTHILSSV